MTWAKSKHRGKRASVDGLWFDSREEAGRYSELYVLTLGGLISDLSCHMPFPLTVNGYRIGRYTPDFRYLDRQVNREGVWTIEEWKPTRKLAMSRDAVLRMRLFRALYPQYRYVVSNSKQRCVEFDEWVKRKPRRTEWVNIRDASR